MSIRNKVLILECIPKKEEEKEGKILNDFLTLEYDDIIDLKIVGSKTEFFQELKGNNHRYIHISCHGEEDGNGNIYMEMPKGRIYPEEFNYRSGLKNRYCFLSACSLAKEKFVDPFWDNVKPNVLIAPQRDIDFINASLFWMIFYYNHFYIGKSMKRSYEIAKASTNNPGAMKHYWSTGFGRK